MKANIEVSLNGTNENPFHKLGLKCNPFPQTATMELDAACMRMQSLGADPIPHDDYKNYIRKTLEGFSEEFIQGCIDRFVPGQYVTFVVTWDEGD